jgi:hypothetical protein
MEIELKSSLQGQELRLYNGEKKKQDSRDKDQRYAIKAYITSLIPPLFILIFITITSEDYHN